MKPGPRTGYRVVGVTIVLAALVATMAAPVRSQSETQLRQGVWIGEALAVVSLEGNVDGTAATYEGNVSADISFEVAQDGTVFSSDLLSSGWLLTGSATMDFEGDVSFTILQQYSGIGSFTGDRSGLTMSGDMTTTGSVSGAPVEPQTATFELQIEILEATCSEVYGDWESPIEQLAVEAGWSRTVVGGIFSAVRFGSENARAVFLAKLEQLSADVDVWAQEMIESTSVDLEAAIGLIERAIALYEARTVDCTDEPTSNYTVPIMRDILQAVFDVLEAGDLTGTDLLKLTGIVAALPSFGSSGLFDAIHEQSQRIVETSLTSDGNSCDPCLSGGGSGTEEVRAAALASKLMGKTFEIGLNTYTADEVIAVVSQ